MRIDGYRFGRVLVDDTPEVAMRDPQVVEAYLGTHGDGDARGR